jgi:long-chain acyl-CoA synthetase
MTTEIEKRNEDLKTLKYVVGIDGPDSIAAFEKATASRFWILYGQSETSGFVTFSQASDKLGTAGKQGPISSFILVDENDIEVPVGGIGEIAVRGPLVFQGYWKQDELNARTFRNGWHHTGDFGQLDEEGYLIYKGRKPEKELIKPGGENVYPAEVEVVIMQHPAVEAVSVIGVPDPKFGEGVKAVCVLKHGENLDAKSLIEFVGSRIARYKKPGYVQFVDELPMKGGVIDRIKVKELYGS